MNKDELLKSTLEDLNRLYTPGLYEFLYEHHGSLFKELQGLESELDHAFLYDTIEELKKALRDYWVFHMRVIEIFKVASKGDIPNSDVRQEMLEERLDG